MALRNANPETAGAPTPPPPSSGPAFEAMEGEETTVTGKASPANDPVAAQPAPPSAERAVAAPARTAVVVNSKLPTDTTWEQLQNVLSPDVLEDMGYGAFPRLTANSGGSLTQDKTKVLGEVVKIEVLSWNLVWLVSAGEPNTNVEANKLIRNSRDGVNLLNNEGTIEDYLKKLKVDGYDKASCKKYVEIYGNVVETSKGGKVPVDDQVIVQVSVSPQSVSLWQAFLVSSRLRKGRGIVDSPILTMTGSVKTLGPNTFGLINFSTTK